MKLPRILIGEIVRRQAIRKWVWIWGGVTQDLCLAAIGWVEGTIFLLGLAGLAGSLLSLRWKEVSGRCEGASNPAASLTARSPGNLLSRMILLNIAPVFIRAESIGTEP
ncbi:MULTISPECIES: hypothetical protein [unclassified Thiocapsa]|uniref:hypothetical protein n=1 Tax=unclassified Thiocapsa TaxID=2641286 RepID=UPI0035AF7F25